jgi:uncharacterized protein YqeY
MVYFFDMTMQETIRADMVAAMKAKEEIRLRVLRGLITSFTNELTATKRTPQDSLEDDEVIGLIRRALKQRKEAAAQYRDGGRSDLAENEEEEASVLEAYLPQMMSKEEIADVVAKKKEALGVTDKRDMGKLMGAVMGELKGKADGGDVKDVVAEALS